MVASFAESSSTRGNGLKISYGEMVRWALSDNGRVNGKGLCNGDPGKNLGEDKDPGEPNWLHGESGGVVAGERGDWASTSSSS